MGSSASGEDGNADGGGGDDPSFSRHQFPALQSPSARLMSPGVLAALHSFAAEPSEEDELAFVRLARDRRIKSFVPPRKNARILNPIDAPPERAVLAAPPLRHVTCRALPAVATGPRICSKPY